MLVSAYFISILCTQTLTEAKKNQADHEDSGKASGHSRGKSGKSEPTSKADTPAGSGPEDADEKKNKDEKMDVDGEIPEGTDMASVIKRRRAVAARDAKVRIHVPPPTAPFICGCIDICALWSFEVYINSKARPKFESLKSTRNESKRRRKKRSSVERKPRNIALNSPGKKWRENSTKCETKLRTYSDKSRLALTVIMPGSLISERTSHDVDFRPLTAH